MERLGANRRMGEAADKNGIYPMDKSYGIWGVQGRGDSKREIYRGTDF